MRNGEGYRGGARAVKRVPSLRGAARRQQRVQRLDGARRAGARGGSWDASGRGLECAEREPASLGGCARDVQCGPAMTLLAKSEWRSLSMLLALALALGGCVASMEEDLDPATTLGEEEWSDEGPPAGEEAEDAPYDDEEEPFDPDLGTSSEALSTPRFQLPFPCGQVWAGQTRTNHSPVNSIDFNRANDIGDVVVAAAAGTVSRVGNEGDRSYGRWIEIDHGSGYRTRYAHLASQSVSFGQRVSRGQRIGTVGNTGGSSGPHLHYEVRRSGVAIRPVFNGSTALFFGTRNYTDRKSVV